LYLNFTKFYNTNQISPGKSILFEENFKMDVIPKAATNKFIGPLFLPCGQTNSVKLLEDKVKKFPYKMDLI